MSRFINSTVLAMVPLALIAFAANTEVGAAAPNTGPLRCEVRVAKAGGVTKLEGVVHAASAVSGTYHLVIAASGGGGSSDIEQSGSFSAKAGSSEGLGTVMLGGSSANYTAKLSVQWNGGSTSCTQRVVR
jgi:hypothetical protein